MTDVTPWAVDLSFADLESTGFKGVLGGLFGGGKKDKDASAPTLQMAGAVFKEAPLYGENTPLPLKKTLSITRSEDFEVSDLAVLILNLRSPILSLTILYCAGSKTAALTERRLQGAL